MARTGSDHPTELELEILKVLWERGPLSARQVQRWLAKGGRDLAYSSVITMCNLMVGKEQLSRHKEERAFVFTPTRSREEVAAGMTGDLLDRLFEGSASAMMLGLFDAADLDAGELAELRKIMNRKARTLRNAETDAANDRSKGGAR